MNDRAQEQKTPEQRAVARVTRASAPTRLRRLLGHGSAGMTLIEIMVVVIIMGLIASAVGFSVFKYLGRAKVQTAEQEVMSIRSAIQIYQNDHSDQCPTVEQLVQEGQLDHNASTTDPWHHAFTIACDGDNITVASAGPDGRAGTADDIPHANGGAQQPR